ncbi:MerR HTH family regulatory protein [Halobacteriovorax sp. BALOs_7]|uniref:MerR family transcriptional regulator n=1 Tax=Halobacteriovorax vibrionivorans TaxID=2152716 RepID=A0ABY0IG70_9BACT|nr:MULTISPECIES: MerR family transcriptional regulator [Halobacteriovorax]AYF45044.1 MerR HTH family regulatory protein [Halobacteriovorax sp. BALOs_7]RZF21108.1 MerR family transcriptional regulator [Halobacteriovorax vibrionivorans]TGD47006.1 MerR family transcriptional regulator [Halobacteriovorax sp. Y22]
MLENLDIPQKSLFKLDEVCTIVGVKPYVLRFWESEFEEVSPLVSSTGQKLFEQKDIQILAKIKSLLFDNKLSIDKAKLVLNGKLDLEKATKPKKVVARSNKPIKAVKSKMANFDIDLDKLEQARGILKELNLKSQSIQQRNNWI